MHFRILESSKFESSGGGECLSEKFHLKGVLVLMAQLRPRGVVLTRFRVSRYFSDPSTLGKSAVSINRYDKALKRATARAYLPADHVGHILSWRFRVIP